MSSVKLPHYNPESLGLVPAEHPMTSEQLISRYQISKSQFHNRKNALPHIQGFTHGRKKMFSPSEIYQLDAVAYYILSGYSLDDITDAYEGAEPELQDSSSYEVEPLNPTPQADPNQLSLAITPQMSAYTDQLGAMIVTAVEKIAKPQTDPLRSIRYLKEACEEEYPLTPKMLAEILDLKLSTVHGLKSGEVRHGFELVKKGIGKWQVTRAAA